MGEINETRAGAAVDFFQQELTFVKGRGYGGQPFILPPFQKRWVRDLLGTLKRDGLRQYDEAYLEIPKKNGKTTFAAGLALYCLLMDNEPGAEIYSAASTRDQASKVFDIAAQMVKKSRMLTDLCRVVEHTKTIYMREDITSFYKAVSSDAGGQDGADPHAVIFDELHRQKNRDLWDVLEMGSDTREQPLTIAITTAGIESESVLCWEQHERARQVIEGTIIDPSFYPVIFAAGEKEDWTSPKVWRKANPALRGRHPFLRIDRIQKLCSKAQVSPSAENSFRRLRLNQWVSQEERWLQIAIWDKCKKPFDVQALQGKDCFAAYDLSNTLDITALILLFPVEDEIMVVPHFWLPKEELAERSRRDKVPYDKWAAQNLIHTTDGNIIDYRAVRQTINDLGDIYNIKEIAYDPWNATQISLQLDGDGFKMVPVRQGYVSLSAPMKELLRLVMSNSIRHAGNPVLRWMADCVVARTDPADNIKPVKPDRNRSRKRIDGIVALIMGIDRIMRDESKASVYETRGLRSI